MEKAKNGYATNKGGLIKAPTAPTGNDPKSTTVAKNGGDLRSRK